MNIEKNTKKSFNIHKVTAKNFLQWYIYDLDTIFDSLIIDDTTEYMFKFYSPMWYSDNILRSIYEHKNCHIYLNLHFKFNEIPKRCEKFFKELCEDFYHYLAKSRTRISKVKMRCTVRLLLKNISRLKFHKKYAIIYSKKEANWVGVGNNYSHNYFEELINYLVSIGVVKDFTGFSLDEGQDNKMSMLLVLPQFIDKCNGYGTNLIIDNELLSGIRTDCEIRVKESKNSHKVIKPSKEEADVFTEANQIMIQLNDLLRNTYITIGNVAIPEYFLTRIFRDNMCLGGRCFDKGHIQGQSSTIRALIQIDMEDTIEIDYGALHYSMAAEELGLDLKDKDPYDFPFNIEVDQEELEKWKELHGVSDYNPIRNLKKTALLTMLNADDKVSAIGGISESIRRDYRRKDKSTRRFVGMKNIPVSKLVEAVIENNQEIASYFNTGVGLRFQNLDSKMITYCIEKFITVDQVLLPVHDSIIIKKSLKDFGVKCMEDAFEHVMGSKVNCRLK
jgi:hypothetical protein